MGKNLVRKIVELRKQSQFDDLLCYDGEVIGAEWLFPDPPGKGSSEPDSPEAVTPLPGLEPADASVPVGAKVLLAHRVSAHFADYDGSDVSDKTANLIFTDSEGNLMWLDSDAGVSRKIADKSEIGIVRESVDIGAFLAVSCDRGLFYALWSHEKSDYIWLGKSPLAPSPEISIVSKALSPYSVVDGDLPEIVADLTADENEAEAILNWLTGREANRCPLNLRSRVRNAVAESLKIFLEDVKNAGLWFQDVYVAAAWLTSAVKWNLSTPIKATEADDLKLKINETSYSSDVFRIKMTLSRAPYCIEVKNPCESLSDAWKNVVEGVRFFVSRELSVYRPTGVSEALYLDSSARGFILTATLADVPDAKSIELTESITVEAEASSALIHNSVRDGYAVQDYFSLPSKSPDFIRNVNSRLVSIRTAEDGTLKNFITVSAPFLPMAITGENELGGEKIINVMHSLRPLSSGQLGDFPLHAFAADGIRALSPKNNSFVDVQLISRDVPASPHGFAPLPEGNAFLSSRGVMEIEGTNVKCISDSLERQTGARWNVKSDDFLAYDYPANSLILYNPGRREALVFMRSSGKWTKVNWCPDSHFYMWPWLLIKVGNEIKRLSLISDGGVPMSTALLPVDLLTLTTRPIKFSSPFTVKKLKKVEAVWPDGVRLPFTVYGSLRPGVWHVLGHSAGSPIRLEGSGWRFFKLDIAIKRPENLNYEEIIAVSKPLIMFEFQNCG